MKIDVIVGGLYGDEGKGKIVSNLGNNYDYIFRVNASTNASHTVKLNNGEEFITKQLPSVFNNNKIKFVVGPGAIMNLKALKEELKSRNDIDDIKNHVYIASSISLLISPYIERNKQSSYSKKYGSTNQGTGNAVIARDGRHSIKLMDVVNVVDGIITKDELVTKIKESCRQLDHLFFEKKDDSYYLDEANSLINDYLEIKSLIGDFSIDYTKFLYDLDEKSKILIEGCNGIMLDNLHGLVPYTTSASTSINALLNGANLSPCDLNDIYVIITGYFCCLNKRPFLTEMSGKEQDKIYKHNSEVDDAEGMKRRIGWFDLPTLRKALVGHKKCKLILNKLDIMQDLEFVKICDYYVDNKGNKIYVMPDNTEEIYNLKPHYVTIKGWRILDGVKDVKKVPIELRNFISYVEKEVNRKIVYLGVGRKVDDLISYDSELAKDYVAIIEGTDAVGKSSTILELEKRGIICRDRSKDVISKYMLFSVDLNERVKIYHEYLKTIDKKIIFLVNNDKKELEKRVNSRLEVSSFDIETYAYNKLYIDTYNYMKENNLLEDKLFLVDCTNLTLKEQVEKVIEIIGDK